jgi:hypothetical protein
MQPDTKLSIKEKINLLESSNTKLSIKEKINLLESSISSREAVIRANQKQLLTLKPLVTNTLKTIATLEENIQENADYIRDYTVELECEKVKLTNITDVEVGDVFMFKNGNSTVIIVENRYDSYKGVQLFNFAGLDSALKLFSDYRDGATKEEIISYLNANSAEKAGNISEGIRGLVAGITRNHNHCS